MAAPPRPPRHNLTGALSSGRFPPSWILAGPAEDTLPLAMQTAAVLVCVSAQNKPCGTCLPCRKVMSGNHSDVVTVDTQPGDGHVKRFRGLVSDAWIKPGEADVKVYILPDAGRITPPAQNVLLKLLEDPPPYAVFFLLCRSPDELLPTVRSRCRIETCRDDRLGSSGVNPESEIFLAAITRGELAAAEWAVKASSLKREEAIALLEGAVSLLRAADPGAPALHVALLDAIQALEGNAMIASALMALAVRCTAEGIP